jgi:hypothetical protein
MFPLHDRTRQKLAIAGFVFLCLLPTCAVAGWCLWRNMPWEAQFAAEKLQQQLGWKVKLERLAHPRPGMDVYEKLELLDPETGRVVFSCKSVSVGIRPVNVSLGDVKPMLVFVFDQPELEAASISQFHQLIERALQDRVAPGVSCYFLAEVLRIRRGKAVESYYNIDTGVFHSADSVQAALRFHLRDNNATIPIKLFLTRDRNATPPENHFNSDAPENEIPRDLLALMGGAKLK